MTSVVITGASMGIGRALALAWAERGARLVLSARSEDALVELAREIERRGGSAIVVAGDVTDAAYRRTLIERAAREAGGIDVLVNNAGRGYYASFTKVEMDELRSLFELNVIAPLELAQLALPHLERSRGTIVMMSSIAGIVATPKYAAYSASKFALEAISMAMRAELTGKGVEVVVVRPGPVSTPFRANAKRGAGETGYDAPDPKSQTAETIAERTIRAVERHRSIDETSGYVRLASIASRWTPAGLRMVLRRMASKD
jgi:short-subunit dehydrogenase